MVDALAPAPRPQNLRYHINRFGAADNPKMKVNLTEFSLASVGNIPVDYALEEGHAKLTYRVKTFLKNGGIPFAMVGGND